VSVTLKVLVTGVSGLLGNRVGDVLAAAGHHVVGTYRANEALVWTTRLDDLVRCNLAEATDVTAKLASRPFDLVVHTAALAQVDRCESHRDEAYSANVIATRNVIDLASRAGARVLFVSTSSVFDGQSGDYVESATPNPCNYYSWTKLLGEEIARAGCDSLTLRATLIGAHPRGRQPSNFVEWLVGMLRANRDLTLFDDVMINPLTDISIAEIVARLITRDFGGTVLHAGTVETASKAAIGRAIAAHFPGYTGKLTISASDSLGPSAAPRAKQMWLNTDKLTAFGWARYDIGGEIARLAAQGFGDEAHHTRGPS
jgi:dTDP-4-dehydrorhamnose reductase